MSFNRAKTTVVLNRKEGLGLRVLGLKASIKA